MVLDSLENRQVSQNATVSQQRDWGIRITAVDTVRSDLGAFSIGNRPKSPM